MSSQTRPKQDERETVIINPKTMETTAKDKDKQQVVTPKIKPIKDAKYWDQLAKEITKQQEQEDKEDTSNPNKFLEMLYQSGDDDTRRAMMKSMYESKGTTLSMNWKDIKDKSVDEYKDPEPEPDSDNDSD